MAVSSEIDRPADGPPDAPSAPVPAKPPAFTRFAAWLRTPGGIATLFVVGLLIRLALISTQGFPYDMASFRGWSQRLAERGPWNFYPGPDEDYFVDYPPGYLYVLWIVGGIARLLGTTPGDAWIKLPPIFADLALAWVVGLAAVRLAPAAIARRVPVRAIACAAILLNPAIFFVSAVWGQADSAPTLIVAVAFVLLGTGVPSLRREAGAMALLAVAIGTKPQTGFVVPVAILLLLWRHLVVRVDATDDPLARRRELGRGFTRLVVLAGAAVAAGFVLFLPFRLYPGRALDFYASSSGQYKVTSVFAFNLWGAIEFWRPDSGAEALKLLGIPVVIWGLLLFVAASALVLARAWAALRNGQDEGRVLVFGSMAISRVGFAVVTRIHERYLFLPIALGMMLVGSRWMRRTSLLLSVLYLVNVYFPYVYYLRQEKLAGPDLGAVFDAIYGTGVESINLRLWSVAITVVCLVVAFRGWKALEVSAAASDLAAVPGAPTEVVAPPPSWSLRLHPVGARNAWIALAVFAVAFVTRLVGLGHPPGMYFDEVYHARTGAEYLGNKEVFEYTHPPFAKEVMGFSIQHLSGFVTEAGGSLPRDVQPAVFGPRPNGVLWARTTGATTRVHLGAIDPSCDVDALATAAETDVQPDAIAATPNAILLAGISDDGPVLVRIDGSEEVWRAALPSRATSIAVLGERAYIATAAKQLVSVSPEGEPDTEAIGVGAITRSGPDGMVWASFPEQRRLSSYDAQGERKTVIEVEGDVTAIAAPDDTDRVYAAVGAEVLSYDAESQDVQSRIGGAADLLATVPETTAIWAITGRDVRIIEPHSGVVVGRTTLDRVPEALSVDPVGHRLVAISQGHLECASGRPQFAWRLGSAVMGALMITAIFLLALRLMGNRWAGLLAALFLTIDGLAFTMSRMAMNDSYATGFMLLTWFCVLSALRSSGRGRSEVQLVVTRRERLSAVGWLLAAGVCAGLGFASKWPVFYGMVGVGALTLWDAATRKRRSIWYLFGGAGRGSAIVLFALVALPLAIYLASYVPYFGLGHDIGEWFELQRSMLDYHASLDATHPFGSPWYGWPFGYRAVYLYLANFGAERAEIWSIPNLVVVIGGLVAMGILIVEAFRRRSVALVVLALGALVQYLPWVAVTRVTFMYHYLPIVPFLCLALAWALVVRLAEHPQRRVIVVTVTAAAVVFFALLYPMLVGWQMPASYGDAVRKIIPWVI